MRGRGRGSIVSMRTVVKDEPDPGGIWQTVVCWLRIRLILRATGTLRRDTM